jgi:signal transduction histidine kinase
MKSANVEIAQSSPPMPASLLRRWRDRSGRLQISTRLLLIIASCLLPAVALYAVLGWSLWAERKAQLGDLVLQQAELLAGDLDSIAEGARILLSAAGEFHQIRALGSECSARLTGLQRNAPSFAFIAYVDGEGRIACASSPDLVRTGDDLAWIEGARAASTFTADRYTRSSRYPGGFVPFYLPIPGDGQTRGGQTTGGTLVAALDLNWLERHLHGLKQAGSPYLAGGVLTIADANLIVLARDARHADFVGKQLPPAAMEMTHALKPGILRMRSMDGTERLIAFSPPTEANHNLAAVVGFYEPDLMGDVRHALQRWAIVLLCTTAAAFGLTLLVARSIARPTQALVAVAHRWREGDLTARATGHNEQSQFGQIAMAFNQMVAALQCREEKLRAHAMSQEAQIVERTRELVVANDRLRREMSERQEAEAALLQAQKVQAVGLLAGGIAHDFNNILQAILSGASLIRRRADNMAVIQRMAGVIEDTARRGTSITGRLLAFARREELRAEMLSPSDLLGGLHEVLAATLGANILVTVDAPPDLPGVRLDRGQLETVLVNLATNARDAMTRGGTVAISATAERILDEDGPSGLAPGLYVALVVSDSGEGMSAETLARASEPFFTTKPLGRGTGLGLAMARSFAEASGGKLTIESELGKGTKITLWLPANSQEVAASPPRSQAASPTRWTGEDRPMRLLLVDDEPLVREVLATQLRDEGYAVIEAADGPQALDLFASGPPIDLLITDLTMPGMDGITLIREIQQRRSDMPAILLTGFAGDVAALAIGVTFTLLRKPLSGTQLADHVAALLAVVSDPL